MRGVVEEDAVRHLYVQTYAALAEQLRGGADGDVPAAAFALVGDADLLPVTVVQLAFHPLDGLSTDAFIDGIVVDAAQRFAEPELVELTSGSGQITRLQQLRIVDEGEGLDPTVQTSVVHVCPGPTDGVVTTLSAWFPSPVDAQTSRAVLDELAKSLRLGPA